MIDRDMLYGTPADAEPLKKLPEELETYCITDHIAEWKAIRDMDIEVIKTTDFYNIKAVSYDIDFYPLYEIVSGLMTRPTALIKGATLAAISLNFKTLSEVYDFATKNKIYLYRLIINYDNDDTNIIMRFAFDPWSIDNERTKRED